MGLYEVNVAAELIQKCVDPEANIIFGAVIDESLNDEIVITIVATGFEKELLSGIKQNNVLGKFQDAKFGKQEPEAPQSDMVDIPSFLKRKK